MKLTWKQNEHLEPAELIFIFQSFMSTDAKVWNTPNKLRFTNFMSRPWHNFRKFLTVMVQNSELLCYYT